MARFIREVVFTAKTGTGASLEINNTSHPFPIASITTTVGATPTMDIAIQGSVDGTNWENILGAEATITSATTTIIKPIAGTTSQRSQEWYPHYRLNISANTNVTVASATLAVGGFAGVDGER